MDNKPNMTDEDILWRQRKVDYAQPVSDVDMGELYYWAGYWHEQYLESCKVREMTVEEVAKIISGAPFPSARSINKAQALTKLGTIRIVEEL